MNTPEHVFALFIEANPVVDPSLLDRATDWEGDIMHVVDRDELTEERRPESDRRGGLSPCRGWKPAMVAAAVVLLVGAVGLGAVLFTTTGGPVAAESAEMAVVFDGSSCAYSGPTELLAGDGVVSIERTPDAEPVALVVTKLRDGEDAIDLAAAEEWAATHTAQEIPAWLAGFDIDYLAGDATGLQLTTTFEEARYLVSCHTSPQGTNRVHVGTILTVTSG